MAQDLYTVLGVAKEADADTIKKAYRKLAKDLHPDRNPGNKQIETRFKAINHAFDVLNDSKKRALYDEFGEEGLREGFDVNRSRQYKNWASSQQTGRPGRPSSVPGGGSVNLEDLFGGETGAGFGDMFGDIFRGRARTPRKGETIESEATIDFDVAVRGGVLEIHPPSSPDTTVPVRIPAGAPEGGRLRVPGHGAPSRSGGAAGDLMITIRIRPHPFFRREEDDLHLNLPLTVAEAYRGAKVRVPTIDGSVTVKVPERTQSGAVARLRGKGIARKGQTAGDLYVHYEIMIPTEASTDLDLAIDRIAAYQKDDLRKDIKL